MNFYNLTKYILRRVIINIEKSLRIYMLGDFLFGFNKNPRVRI